MSYPAPLRIALIIGSTRIDRFADVPARWLLDGAAERDDLTLEVLDLRDYQLPFLGEPYAASSPAAAAVAAWRRDVARADGYLVTAAEYNHAPTAVLKNALDHANSEWHQKPIGFVGYGGVGGARAVEHLRHIAVELQMVPIKAAIHVAGDVFSSLRSLRTDFDAFPHLTTGRTMMLDQLVWWGRALREARERDRVAFAEAAS